MNMTPLSSVFTGFLRRLLIECCLAGLYALFFHTGNAPAQTLDHFDWGVVPNTVAEGQPLALVLTARDLGDNVLASFSGLVTLTAITPVSSPTLLITEVETIYAERVELSNVSTNAVDVSGWRLVVYDAESWPAPKATFIVPAGTVCPAFGEFQVRDYGPVPGTYPVFSTGVGLVWSNLTADNQVAVELFDANGALVDFYCAVDAYPPLISVPIPISTDAWIGPPVTPNTNPALTYQRGHHANGHSAADWSAAANTFGMLNPGLEVPFIGTPSASPLLPGSVTLTNGFWNGQVVIASAGTNIVLHADDQMGHAGDSSPLTVLRPPSLSVQVPHQAFKATPGLAGQGTVTLPQAVSTNVAVALSSSLPGQIVVPASITITAGTTSDFFALTNLDDGLLDGPQASSIAASAPGFAPAEDTITNLDRVPAVLSLSLPASLVETADWSSPSQLSSSAPPAGDVAVHLSSSNPGKIQVPEFLILPAGQTSVSFGFAVVHNPALDGDQTVTVSASVAGWTGAQAQVVVQDAEKPTLSLTLPYQVNEGSGVLTNAGTVQIGGTLSTNLVVTLTSSLPTRLGAPSNVVVPAGQLSASFNLAFPEDPLTNGNQTATLTATVPGFTTAARGVLVIGNDVASFSFATMPAAVVAGQGFVMTVQALNASGSVTPGYSGSANLAATGFQGAVLVLPAVMGPFINGVWSGQITLPNPDHGVVLAANDGLGHTGVTTPFDVVPDQVLSLPAAALVYDALRNKIMAGVVATTNANSQSVVSIDPATGGLGTPIPLGADPSSLAISDDFSYLYAAMDVNSTGGVVRVDLNSQAVDLRFALGTVNQYGQSLDYVEDMKVQPGHPHTLLATTKIAYGYDQFIGVYDDGVMRPDVVVPVYYVRTYHLTFGGSPTNFFITKPNGLWLNQITPTGATFLQEIPGSQYGADMTFAAGDLYSTGGLIFNTNDFRQDGQFPASGYVIPDLTRGRVYFLSWNGAVTSFQAFDRATFLPIVSLALPNVSGQPSGFVQCGSNTFAFQTTGGQVHIFDTSFLYTNAAADLTLSVATSPAQPVMGSNLVYSLTVSNGGPATSYGVVLTNQIPFWCSFVSAASTAGACSYSSGVLSCALGDLTNGAEAVVTLVVTPNAAGLHFSSLSAVGLNLDPNPGNNVLTDVRSVLPGPAAAVITPFSLPNNDIVYDPATQRIWASVPPIALSQVSNCLINFDPVTGAVGVPVPAGRQPNQLALAPGGEHLYAGLDGDSAVRRFDTVSQAVYPEFPIGSGLVAALLAVMPGAPQSVAVSTYNVLTAAFPGVSLYDNGVARPQTLSAVWPHYITTVWIQFSADGSILYGSGDDYGYFSINGVTPDGLVLDSSIQEAGLWFAPEMMVIGQTAYFTAGYEIDIPSASITKPFPIAYAPAFCVDAAANRVFFVSQNGAGWLLQQYDLTSCVLQASLTLPPVLANPQHLQRWGADGLAFRDSSNQVFLVSISRLPQVPPPAPVPRLAVSQTASPTTSQVGGNVTYTLTVTNPEAFDASAVLLTDALPRGATLVSSYTPQGSITQDQNGVECSLGTIPQDSSVTLSLVASLGLAGLNLNSNVVTAGGLVLTNSSSTSFSWQWANFAGSPQLFSEVNLPVADLAYDPAARRIYASVVDAGGPLSNRLVGIDAATGELGLSISLPVTPGIVALSDDGAFIYVGQDGSNAIARVNVAAAAVDLQFLIGTPESAPADGWTLEGMSVMPGHPHTLAVARGGNYADYGSGVAIFDDGMMRPSTVSPYVGTSFYRVNFASPTSLYATSPMGLQILAVTPAGVSNTPPITNAYAGDFAVESGLVFAASGAVFNPATATQIGVQPASGLPVPDLTNGRVYYLTTYSYDNAGYAGWWLGLHADDAAAYRELFAVYIPPVTGVATRLVNLGTNGLACATDENRMFLFPGTLVTSPSADVSVTQTGSPATVTLDATMTYSATAVNAGPWTATGVVASNPLPAGVKLASATVSQGTCAVTNGAVVCAFGSIAVGGAATLTLQVIPTNAPGVLTNSVFVTATERDPVLTNNAASIQTTVLGAALVGGPDVAVVASAGKGYVWLSFMSSPPIVEPIYVNYATADGTALAGRDYQPSSGVVSLQYGRGSIALSIIDPGTPAEPNRYFYLDLSGATNASLGRTQIVVNIIGSLFPVVSISGGTVLLPGGGATNVLFNLVMNTTSPAPVTVQYRTLDGSAVAGSDYEEKSGTLVFPAGVSSLTLAVPVLANPWWAPPKTFSVVLSEPQNALLGVDTAVGTILNTNPVPALSYALVGNSLVLTWPGPRSLQVATNVVGPYSDVPGAASPYTIGISSEPERFFRVDPSIQSGGR
jgi:uncharacterized repeat protein (TIGR01451 family)